MSKVGNRENQRAFEWKPKGGETFIHSHYYESGDGSERLGAGAALEGSVLDVAGRLLEKASELSSSCDALLPESAELDRFLLDEIEKVRASG